MARLVLWDIDGTLTRGGRSAVAAYQKTLASTWEITEELVRIHTSGMTDDQIAFETLALYKLAEADVAARLDAFRKTYADEVGRTREQLVGDLVLLPGVPEALAALKHRGAHQSLLTGNYEPVARIKLECVGIDRFLDFEIGAFGSDHRHRDELVPIALEKARRLRGLALAPSDVVVVGDTPRDVACARAGGACAVAVATGGYSKEDLVASKPDVLLDDLTDLDAALAAILSG
jgi:phosphoglycolate phosphatase